MPVDPDARREVGWRAPSQEHLAEMGKLGKITVIDGPFTESKELIAGFAIIQAKSREEAVERAKRFVRIAGDGESELRQIMEPEVDFAQR